MKTNIKLMAGCAHADITPALGIHMGGYWGRVSGATSVGDPLRAKVLAFAYGASRVVLVALDLVALDRESVQLIRGRIRARCGLAEERVMICCSHTHAGPLTCAFRGMGEVDRRYLGRVHDTVVELVDRALKDMRPVNLKYRRVEIQLGVNRRYRNSAGATTIGQNPQGAVAAYAHAVDIGTGTTPLAVLFSHACHPVVLGNANHAISGDFAGAAERYIETHTGALALFINGACGDINPRLTGADFAAVEALGAELGRAVIEALKTAEALAGQGVDGISSTEALPLIRPPSARQIEVEKLILKIKSELKRIRSGGGDIWAQRVPQARLDWAKAMGQLVRSGVGDTCQPFEIQGLRIGDLVLLGMEGEIFVRYQLDLEPLSPRQPAILCGFSNGCIGYVPTADEYERGGYEVDEAYKVYPSVQMIGPDSEELIRKGAVELLEGLA